ncbi:MAG: hypothetical protein GF330_06155 [Candidatus Eisenbacteria bacterium]|nr:hypothetical protein [Candidatus Eisenbacteria bacterium]
MRRRRARRRLSRLAVYLVAPLLFLTLLASMVVGLRVQLLRKEIAGLELCRESLAVQIFERRRQIAAEVDFAELEPHARTRDLHPAASAQLSALSRAPRRGADRQDLPARVLDFLTRAPEAHATALDARAASSEASR